MGEATNYFYDLPDDLQFNIYKELHKIYQTEINKIIEDGILPEGSVADTTFTEFDGLRLRRSLRDQMKGYKYTFDILALKSQNK